MKKKGNKKRQDNSDLLSTARRSPVSPYSQELRHVLFVSLDRYAPAVLLVRDGELTCKIFGLLWQGLCTAQCVILCTVFQCVVAPYALLRFAIVRTVRPGSILCRKLTALDVGSVGFQNHVYGVRRLTIISYHVVLEKSEKKTQGDAYITCAFACSLSKLDWIWINKDTRANSAH